MRHRSNTPFEQAGLDSPTKETSMLRAMFFSTGLFVFLLGVQFLAVDKMILHGKDETPRDSQFRGLFTTVTPQGQRVFDPQDWSAFALMSVGSVTMLYAAALPKRKD